MLKPQDRLYFIHIPKTAGTTLIPHLDARFHVDEICPAQLWPELLSLRQEMLPRYRLFRGHFGAKGLDSFLPEPPMRITMLRHPVPLALSTYQFIVREPGTSDHRLVKKMSFADFLQHPKARLGITNKQVRNLCFELRYPPGTFRSMSPAADHWMSEHRVIYRTAQEQFDQALAVLHECVFFGLVERFDESMALLSWTFGWPPARQVQKLMVAPSSSSEQPPISEQLAAQIYACNTLDLALYEAAEKLFEKQLAAMMEGLKSYTVAGEKVPKSFSEDPELTHILLERHYQHHWAAQASSKKASIQITFAEPLQGSGWHRREIAADGTLYRWTGPDTVSTLDIHLDLVTNEDLAVTFLVLDVVSRELLDSMRLTVNGYPVVLRSITKCLAVPRYYRAYISKNILPAESGNIRLTFQVATTLLLGPHAWDPRSVGLAINWIEVCPSHQALPETTLASMLKDVRRPQLVRRWILQLPWIASWFRMPYLYLRAASKRLSERLLISPQKLVKARDKGVQ
jgi:hypothetical protein